MVYKIKKTHFSFRVNNGGNLNTQEAKVGSLTEVFEANLGYTVKPYFKATNTHKESSLFPIKNARKI